MRKAIKPEAELLEHGTVEAELGAYCRYRFARRVLAGNDCRGVARRQPQEEEHKHRDHGHDRDRRQQPAKDVGDHDASLSPLAGRGWRAALAASPVMGTVDKCGGGKVRLIRPRLARPTSPRKRGEVKG